MKQEADILKLLREKHKISQMDLAKKLGYTTPQFISNVERGLCGLPMSALKRITEVYGHDIALDIAIAKLEDYRAELYHAISKT